MKRLLVGLLALALLAFPAVAQTNTNAGIYQVTPDTLTDGQRGGLLTDVNRKLVLGALVPGTAAANLGKAEDAAAVTGDTGIATFGVINATAAAPAADGDYAAIALNSLGQTEVSLGVVRANGSDAVSNSGVFGRFADIAGNPTYPTTTQLMFNGTSWDRNFTCPSTATISVTTGNTTQLVALASSQIIRVCSFILTESLAGTAKFVYGTGSNCGTGTTDITAAMALATNGSLALSSGNGSLFRTIASNALCLTSATGTITGFVTYAQY